MALASVNRQGSVSKRGPIVFVLCIANHLGILDKVMAILLIMHCTPLPRGRILYEQDQDEIRCVMRLSSRF